MHSLTVILTQDYGKSGKIILSNYILMIIPITIFFFLFIIIIFYERFILKQFEKVFIFYIDSKY